MLHSLWYSTSGLHRVLRVKILTRPTHTVGPRPTLPACVYLAQTCPCWGEDAAPAEKLPPLYHPFSHHLTALNTNQANRSERLLAFHYLFPSSNSMQATTFCFSCELINIQAFTSSTLRRSSRPYTWNILLSGYYYLSMLRSTAPTRSSHLGFIYLSSCPILCTGIGAKEFLF